MAITPVEAVLAAGAGYVVVKALDKDESKSEPAPVAQPPLSGGTIVLPPPPDRRNPFIGGGLGSVLRDPRIRGTGFGNWWKTAQSNPSNSVLDKAERKLKAEYNALSSAAKRRGAAELNKKLGTNLTGNESFEGVSSAVGAAGAVAGCAATGVGATVAPLCGIAGAYLGKSIAPFLEDGWDAVSGSAKKVGKKVKDTLGGWLGF